MQELAQRLQGLALRGPEHVVNAIQRDKYGGIAEFSIVLWAWQF